MGREGEGLGIAFTGEGRGGEGKHTTSERLVLHFMIPPSPPPTIPIKFLSRSYSPFLITSSLSLPAQPDGRAKMNAQYSVGEKGVGGLSGLSSEVEVMDESL